MRNIIIMAMMLSLLMWSCQGSGEKSSEHEEVTVYTHRHYSSDQDLFRAFQDETGIRVNVVNASADELIQKMIMEGEQSPADVLITVDDRKSTRLNSSHVAISYAVFCLKKKNYRAK